MLFTIIRYIKGYVRIRVIGYSPERFLNACSYRGIYIWGLKPVSGAYEMNLTIQGFRQLKPVIRKTKAKVVIVERFGLPFFLHKYKKRRFFFSGAVLCLFLIFLMSRYIWNIDISGNQTYTDETLLRFLKSKNVEDGMTKSDVDCARIVKDIRKEYDGIIWVSASIKGTKLLIQIKENTDTIPETQDDQTEDTEHPETPTDIVADYDCTITKMITRTGVPQVEPGAEVKKGDLLVSGQVPVNNDAGETTGYQYRESDADIWGKMNLDYEDEMPLTYEVREYDRIRSAELQLKFGTYYVRLGLIKSQNKNQEIHGFERQIMIGDDFYLPISYGLKTAVTYQPVKKKYDRNELIEKLSQKFQTYCEELEKKGVEIIENDVKIYTESETADARGTLTVIMPVGTSVPSTLQELPDQEEQQKEESKTGE